MNNGELVIKKVLTKLKNKLDKKDFRNNTVELLNVNLEFNPSEHFIDYLDVRKTNRKYVDDELTWYLSMDKSIKGHPGIENNTIWKSCATKKGLVNSNYGNIVFAPIKGKRCQFDFAVEKLISDKCTRQSIIIYTRPSLQWEWADNKHAAHDFTCTTHTQHFINNKNELIYIVNMRSNDAIFGLQNDYCWHNYVYFTMLSDLRKYYPNIKIGKIYWNVGSMHVYSRHWNLLKDICLEYEKSRGNND